VDVHFFIIFRAVRVVNNYLQTAFLSTERAQPLSLIKQKVSDKNENYTPKKIENTRIRKFGLLLDSLFDLGFMGFYF
jgi:hypothetical protein